MVMQTITKELAAARQGAITWTSAEVELDLSGAPDRHETTFLSRTALRLLTSEPRVIIDLIAAQAPRVWVDGQEINAQWDGSQVILEGLAVNTGIEVVVEARCHYSNTGEGLHRYFDPEDDRVYLYTQYEPTDARRVFACFDQPGLKTHYRFTVTAPRHWVALSNQPVEKYCEEGELATWSFAPTPPLSAYITAVVVGEYARVATDTWVGNAGQGDLKIELGVYCRHSLASHCDADNIIEITKHGFDFYHQHYEYPYPWGKYDQVFVPEYNLGAMENPGCVTFTERYLHRDVPTESQKQSRANTIMHEMCHMWFGDLVTPVWWDDLWLKESFADNQGSAAIVATGDYPNEWATFASGNKEWAYRQDALPSTHPIAADIPDVEAAKQNFDGITYAKGAAVLKQLVAYVGEERFYAGVRQYFRTHAHGATTLQDFLQSLGDCAGLSATELDNWQTQWLHTSSPSILKASVERDQAGLVRRLHLQQSCVEQTTGKSVIRPHAIEVGLYALASGEGKLGALPVRLTQAEQIVEIPTEISRAELDYVIVNDRDLTYAQVELSDVEVPVVLQYLHRLEDAVSRAVTWSALWATLIAGRLDPRSYLQAVVAQVPREADGAVAGDILTQALRVIEDFLPGQERVQWGGRLADLGLRIAGLIESSDSDGLGVASEDVDRVKLWASTAVKILTVLPEISVEQSRALRRLIDSMAVNREAGARAFGPTLAWRARVALAAHGRFSEAEVAAALAEDPAGEAHVNAMEARAAMPDATTRRRWWDEVLDGDLPNEQVSAVLAGLHAGSSKPGVSGTAGLFFQAVDEYWQSHTIGMGRRFLRGAYPTSVNLDYRHDAAALRQLAAAWHSHREGAAPASLTRLMVEQRFQLEQSYRIQSQWFPAQ